MAESCLELDPARLFGLFAGSPDLTAPDIEMLPAEAVPEPYHRLLVHEHHMTVTVEEHHGRRVALRVLERRHQANDYARAILLVLPDTGRAVQFGIMHFNLAVVAPDVRDEIVHGVTPLGRILIEHDVLRRIRPLAFLRLRANAAWARWFDVPEGTVFYGRLAAIECEGQHAVELLEVVRP